MSEGSRNPQPYDDDILAQDAEYQAWSDYLAQDARESQEIDLLESTARHFNKMFDRAFGM